MHVIEKISLQMGSPFVSTKCSFVQKVEFQKNSITHETDFLVSFVYDRETSLLHLLFKSVLKFTLERDSIAWDLGEFLFYDYEEGSPICVCDELGSSFSLTCKGVEFVGIEPMRDDWVALLHIENCGDK
jgi:hypothetical protein